MDRARSLLDELLGPERNTLAKEEWNSIKNRDVCAFMLSGLCPYQLFSEAGMNMGRCPYRRHDKYLCKLYKQCESPELEEKEHKLLCLLADIYTSNYKEVLRRKENSLFLSRRSSEYTFRSAILKAKVDDLAKDIEERMAENKLEEALAYLERMVSCESDINSLARLEVCEDCGKEFEKSNQPPRYWELHIKSKLHLAFVTVREKLAEMLQKYREKGSLIPYWIVKIVEKKSYIGRSIA